MVQNTSGKPNAFQNDNSIRNSWDNLYRASMPGESINYNLKQQTAQIMKQRQQELSHCIPQSDA
ncbi:hypothetical protein AVEN_68429-1, partial [Araneus ventricosus]